MEIEFWVSIIVSLLALGWNLFQQWNISVLKGRLDKKGLIHRFQFEKEFTIYSELWSALVDLRNATNSLRPFLSEKSAGETDEESLNGRFNQFITASNKVISIFDHSRPFYSSKVYEKVNKVLRNAKFELIDFEHHGHGNEEQRKIRDNRINDIITSMDEVHTVIRERINFLEDDV
jgi:hypothetical protein